MENKVTVRFRVYGIVQGVGFRPTVARHAAEAGICGSVCNKGPYVEIFAQGRRDQIDTFRGLLSGRPPRRAVILKIDETVPVQADSFTEYRGWEEPDLQEQGEKKGLKETGKEAVGAGNPDLRVFDSFSIIESEKTSGEIFISPDIAICEDCIRELYDPEDRRYLHPFINCTCCGPRLTILDALPYDRERTSMKMFPMCRPCAEEYHSPSSRRYDAQPVCCNQCGPQVYLLPVRGREDRQWLTVEGSSFNLLPVRGREDGNLSAAGQEDSAAKAVSPGQEGPAVKAVSPGQEDPAAKPVGHGQAGPQDSDTACISGKEIRGRAAITAARRTILEGGIVAVKGIGGFHLCCDASNEDAVHLLRVRKHRPAKPFAVMMKNEETVRRECLFNEEQRQILTGHQKPILLLDRRREKSSKLAPSVAPGNPKVGVMLPYAPLQLLLFAYDDGLAMPDCLIMTSGNVSGAPICRDDQDAMAELSGFCDCILSHDRLIRIRADDTVMDFHRGHPYMIRRSRGYAPLPVLLSEWNKGGVRKTGISAVLAVGGELKNTFCISTGNLYYLSPYIGDLEDLRTVRALRETIGRMETLLEVSPQAVVCDLHPKYHSTEVAEEIARQRQIPLYRIQHHYAHVLSCMAENDCPGPVIGAAFDGTGYGTDGTIWGGEVLVADSSGFSREYSIAPFTQTGGDSAARQGWRIAASLLWDYCKKRNNVPDRLPGQKTEDQETGERMQERENEYFRIIERLGICDLPNAKVQRLMTERKIQAVSSTSAGRLFDAVSAMLGICLASTYEGEASIELEFAAQRFLEKMKEKESAGDALADGFLQPLDLVKMTGQNSSHSEIPDSAEGPWQNNRHFEMPGSAENVEQSSMRLQMPGSAENMGQSSIRLQLPDFPQDSRQLPTDSLFASLLEKRLEGEDPEALAFAFHAALAALIAQAVVRTSERTGIRRAALTGGCFQNRLLLSMTQEQLEQSGMEVLIHHLVPPNDGGIALGQAVAAAAMAET